MHHHSSDLLFRAAAFQVMKEMKRLVWLFSEDWVRSIIDQPRANAFTCAVPCSYHSAAQHDFDLVPSSFYWQSFLFILLNVSGMSRISSQIATSIPFKCALSSLGKHTINHCHSANKLLFSASTCVRVVVPRVHHAANVNFCLQVTKGKHPLVFLSRRSLVELSSQNLLLNMTPIFQMVVFKNQVFTDSCTLMRKDRLKGARSECLSRVSQRPQHLLTRISSDLTKMGNVQMDEEGRRIFWK